MKPNRPPLPDVVLRTLPAGSVCLALAAAVRSAAAVDAPARRSRRRWRARCAKRRNARIARLEAEQADDAAAAARSLYWPQAAVSSNAGWSNRQDDTINAIDGQGDLKRYPLSALGSARAVARPLHRPGALRPKQLARRQRSELEAEAAAVQEAAAARADQLRRGRAVLDVVRLEALGERDAERVRDAEWLDRQARLLLDAGRALREPSRSWSALEVEQARLDADEGAEQLTMRAPCWHS